MLLIARGRFHVGRDKQNDVNLTGGRFLGIDGDGAATQSERHAQRNLTKRNLMGFG